MSSQLEISKQLLKKTPAQISHQVQSSLSIMRIIKAAEQYLFEGVVDVSKTHQNHKKTEYQIN